MQPSLPSSLCWCRLFQADDRFRGGERFFPMRSMTKALVALTVLALQVRAGRGGRERVMAGCDGSGGERPIAVARGRTQTL